jgi:hypothetical protein
MPQALPNNPYPAGTPPHQAYATCLALQASFPLLNWESPSTQVCARLLGYMIIHSPTDDGRVNIVNEINSCSNDEELHNLAKFYIDNFLRVCELLPTHREELIFRHLIHRTVRQQKGRTPVPSGHISRPSFDEMQETLKYLLVEPPKDYAHAKTGVSVLLDARLCHFLPLLLGPHTGWLSLCHHRGRRFCVTQRIPQSIDGVWRFARQPQDYMCSYLVSIHKSRHIRRSSIQYKGDACHC